MTLNPSFIPASVDIIVETVSAETSTGNPVTRDYVERDPYTGSYEITPSAELQVLATNNLRMTGNITINPIPSDYGHITWHGSGTSLMIS